MSISAALSASVSLFSVLNASHSVCPSMNGYAIILFLSSFRAYFKTRSGNNGASLSSAATAAS